MDGSHGHQRAPGGERSRRCRQPMTASGLREIDCLWWKTGRDCTNRVAETALGRGGGFGDASLATPAAGTTRAAPAGMASKQSWSLSQAWQVPGARLASGRPPWATSALPFQDGDAPGRIPARSKRCLTRPLHTRWASERPAEGSAPSGAHAGRQWRLSIQGRRARTARQWAQVGDCEAASIKRC